MKFQGWKPRAVALVLAVPVGLGTAALTSAATVGVTTGVTTPQSAANTQQRGPGDSPGPAPGQGPLDPAQVATAVHQMSEEYDISEAEALRRMRLQRHAYVLQQRYLDEHSDVYAGMWLDQEDGFLYIAATRPGVLRSDVVHDPDADKHRIRVVKEHKSLATLASDARLLRTRLGRWATSKTLRVSVDEQANRLRVTHADQRNFNQSRPGRALARATRGLDVAIAGHQERQLKSGHVAAADYDRTVYCSPLACDPPMRGGLRLDLQRDNDGAFGGCTAAFNVRRDDGKPFILTAGHCVTGSGHTEDDNATHNGLPVASESNNGVKESVAERENCGIWPFDWVCKDYALLPYTSRAGDEWEENWLDRRWGHNRVAEFTNCAIDPLGDRPGFECDYYTHWISDAEIPLQGAYVCGTGSATSGDVGSHAPAGWIPGTRCGAVIQQNGDTTIAAICTAPGDSGGPLFNPATGHAIGTLHDGTPAQEGNTCGDFAISTYFNVEYSLNLAQGESGRTFDLITSATG